MRMFLLFTCLAFFILLNGCVLSTNQVIPESDAIFDARLLGNWKDISCSDRASITRGKGKSYEIGYTKDGKTGRFGGRLGRLGDQTFSRAEFACLMFTLRESSTTQKRKNSFLPAALRNCGRILDHT